MRVTPVYGGASIDVQIKALQKNPQIVVATPGRLQDMMRRRKIDMTKIEWVVLDEADEMLDMGFQEEVDIILSSVPEKRHILLFFSYYACRGRKYSGALYEKSGGEIHGKT